MKSILNFATPLSFAFIVFMSCNSPNTTTPESAGINTSELKGQSGVVDNESERNILQVAIGSPGHSTLVAGVLAAGLQDVLTNARPSPFYAQ